MKSLLRRRVVCKNDWAMKGCFLIVFLLSALAIAAQEPQTQSRPANAPPVYHHPVGLEFSYPSDWTVRDSQSGEAELIPPDQQRNERGFTEGFLLWGVGGNFEGPVDSSLSAYVNALVKRTVPFLKQDGEPGKFKGGRSPAMVLSWSGASEDGIQVSAKAFVESHGSFAFALMMLGTQERMAFREPAIREIVSTFRFVEGKRDPALAGTWKSAAAAAQTQSAPDAGMEVDLRADGSFVFLDSSAGGGALNGSWYAGNGRLWFVYPESVFLNFGYELEGEPGARKLTLRHSSGGFQTLIETPSRKQES